MRRLAFVALALVLYADVAWWATQPANEHVRSAFLGAGQLKSVEAYPGDHLQSGYRLWLVGHQLENARAPWLDPYTFRPEGGPLPNFQGWPFGLAYWPLHHLFGTVGAWNALVFLGIVLAGALTAWWLRELEVSRAAALAGGVVFALAPYRLVQSAEHMLGLTALLLPLALLALERGRRGNVAWLAVAAAALASIPLSAQVHLALGALPFFVAYALVRSRSRRVVVTTAVALALAVGAGFLVQQTLIAGSIESAGRPLAEVTRYSADWGDLWDRTLPGGSSGVDAREREELIFLGWLTPFAAAAGVAVLLRARRRGLAAVLGIGAVVPVLLALGTNLPLYGLARALVPPLEYTRVPTRFMPIACLCVAALVAFALARVRAPLVVGAAVAALFLDLRVDVFEPTSPGVRTADFAVLRDRAGGRHLELPVFLPDVQKGAVYMHYAIEAQRERPLGYSTLAPRAADRVARRLRPLNCGNLNTPRRRLLRELDIRTMSFHSELYTGLGVGCAEGARRMLEQLGFRPVGREIFARE